MNELFKLLLKMSISGSIFFAVFYILNFFTQNIFSAKWHLWLIKINMIFYFVPIVSFYDFFTRNLKSSVNLNSVNIVFNEIGKSNSSIPITKYLFIIWILGVVIISFWHFYCYKKFIRDINISTYRDEQLESLVYNCKKNLNINSFIKVRRSYIVTTPMIIGILNPIIIFPRNFDCNYKLEPVIIHELTHYKRKDLLFKIIQLVIVTINWFNPIVYVMNNMFEKWCEISCDEIVAENMSYCKRKEYGETILNIIERNSIVPNSLCFYLCNDKRYIKRRLMMMLNIKKDSKFKKIFGIVLVSAIFTFTAVASVAATTTNINFINNEKPLDINLIGKTYEEALSIIDENGLSFKIESSNDSIKSLLEQEIKEVEKDNSTVRGSITVVNTKSNEVVGLASFARK